jgi:hypothetical protein
MRAYETVLLGCLRIFMCDMRGTCTDLHPGLDDLHVLALYDIDAASINYFLHPPSPRDTLLLFSMPQLFITKITTIGEAYLARILLKACDIP